MQERATRCKAALKEKEDALLKSSDRNAQLEEELLKVTRENQRLLWRAQQSELEAVAMRADADRAAELQESLRRANQRLLLMTEAQCNTRRCLHEAQQQVARLTSWQEQDATLVASGAPVQLAHRAKEEAMEARCRLLEEMGDKARHEVAVTLQKAKDLEVTWRARASAAERRADTAELCVRALEQRVADLEARENAMRSAQSTHDLIRECWETSDWSPYYRTKGQQSVTATDM